MSKYKSVQDYIDAGIINELPEKHFRASNDTKTHYYKHETETIKNTDIPRFFSQSGESDAPGFIEIEAEEYKALIAERALYSRRINYDYEHEKNHLSGWLPWNTDKLYLHRDGSEINRRPHKFQWELLKDDPLLTYWTQGVKEQDFQRIVKERKESGDSDEFMGFVLATFVYCESLDRFFIKDGGHRVAAFQANEVDIPYELVKDNSRMLYATEFYVKEYEEDVRLKEIGEDVEFEITEEQYKALLLERKKWRESTI